jgi:hypothetical protein
MATAPPLVLSAKALRAPLRTITEALAAEFDRPSERPPAWTEVEWRLARAVASMHGVSSLLSDILRWDTPRDFRGFLAEQREHTRQRYSLIAELVDRIGARAIAAGVPIQPLKGAALHAAGIYRAGERPMADLDLLVHVSQAAAAARLLGELGYRETRVTWSYRTFAPEGGSARTRLGEHAGNPIKIDLHTRIAEPLPWRVIELTALVLPQAPQPGLNPYPSRVVLLLHLLLHASGDMVKNGLRLVQVCDVARLGQRLERAEWDEVATRGITDYGLPWALPVLRLTARYFPSAIPARVIAALESESPRTLRRLCQRQSLSDVSYSNPAVMAAPGLWWSHSIADMLGYLWARAAAIRAVDAQEAEAELWASGSDWYNISWARRVFRWATSRPPRVKTMQSVRAALQSTQ